ncbi:autophagy-related protein 13a [Phalaenopsis equestris]|uniref:autophagy-related protein 13a n=1 Tax=Phalaenopsis equestris TaxID=78828 RepID=UPI0009E254FE|nr:autophagy-related protein 13a [Phalaenopsis equestris]
MPPIMAHHQSDASRTEQIISQFFHKTLHAVLTARIPRLAVAGAGRVRRRDQWFNLAIGEFPPALENSGLWQQGVTEPMIVDVILSPRDGFESVAIIERWTTQCDTPLPWGDGMSSSASFYRRTYKKSTLLLRSIYSLLRFLPAYRAFRLLSSSNQSSNYDLSYKVSSIAEPFSREEEKGFKLQAFPPVESQLGHLSVSVLYRPTLDNFNLEVSSLLPPMIIADYVGSPAADPIRAFPSSPSEKGMRPVSYPQRGVRPSAAPVFQRPHSWTTTPMANHPLHSAVDAVAEQRVSPPDYFGQRMTIPRQSGHRKGSFSFEEYRLSPPFSASPTPSPPTNAANALQARLRSETPPVSIPQPMMGRNHLHRTPNFSDPTRSLLPPPSPRNARADVLEDSPSSRSFRKSGDLTSLLYTAPKVLKDTKDDSGRFSSVISSSGSPRFVFSRSSSRKSLQDDLEDLDFSCPFAVDDVDTSESQNRNHDSKDVLEFGQTSPYRSQDAAVGALVHMLRTAPSLRQDQSLSSQSTKSEVNSEASTSSFFLSRKKSDALEELRSYRDMKETLLSKSRSQMLDSQEQTTK